MGLVMKNLFIKTVTLKRGTVVAHISDVNRVPPKLAPRKFTKEFPVNAHLSALLGAEVEIEKGPLNLDVQ